jgi:hypothetical protein
MPRRRPCLPESIIPPELRNRLCVPLHHWRLVAGNEFDTVSATWPSNAETHRRHLLHIGNQWRRDPILAVAAPLHVEGNSVLIRLPEVVPLDYHDLEALVVHVEKGDELQRMLDAMEVTRTFAAAVLVASKPAAQPFKQLTLFDL